MQPTEGPAVIPVDERTRGNGLLLVGCPAFGQSVEKVIYNSQDTTAGYYLAVRPRGEAIQGALVLLTSFSAPESLLPETKLHNVAYANDLLTVVVATPEKLYADAPAVARINAALEHVAATYRVDTGRFVLAGYDYAGPVALRYVELTREQPDRFAIRPQAVVAIDSPVDVLELWQWSKRQVARNSRNAFAGKYIIDLMTKEHGAANEKREAYQQLTPVPGGRVHLGLPGEVLRRKGNPGRQIEGNWFRYQDATQWRATGGPK